MEQLAGIAGHRQNQRGIPMDADSSWQILLEACKRQFFPHERALLHARHTGTPRMLMENDRIQATVTTTSERIQLVLFVVEIVAMFVLARLMDPHPEGLGTHQQLGLPTCFVQKMIGRPCPHCGLTTSFCWMVRGEWQSAWTANPSGFALAFILIDLGMRSLMVLWRGHWPEQIRFGHRLRNDFAIWLVLSLLVWIFRLAG